MEENIDSVKLNFNEDSLWVLNICLAIIMFGVALGITTMDFRRIAKDPKPAFMGLLSQFILLPALTFLIVIAFQPHPSLALGLMLVAACPGGNISNFISQISGGNAALSVSLTAISTFLAIVFTPLNLEIWAGFYPPTAQILRDVHLNPVQVLKTVSLTLGLPLIIGLWFNHKMPEVALKLMKILKPLSILIFAGFVILAFSNNMQIFLEYFSIIVLLVLFHNVIALSGGYLLAWVTGLSKADQKTLAIETGIQNSGLGLLLIFSFFEGLGGMAIIAGWWGIWHILSGLGIAYFWAPRKALETSGKI